MARKVQIDAKDIRAALRRKNKKKCNSVLGVFLILDMLMERLLT